MALSITSIQRINGPACSHLSSVINHDGTARNFNTSFYEIDALIESLGGEAEAIKVLIQLWMAYRRRQSRTVIGVDIA